MGKRKLPMRVWILIMVIIFAIIAIKPMPGAHGIQVKNLDTGGDAATAGLSIGDIILKVNDQSILTVQDFNREIEKFKSEPQEINIKIKRNNFTKVFTYNTSGNIGFNLNENLTVFSITSDAPLRYGDKLLSINNNEFSNYSEFKNFTDSLFPKKVVRIQTKDGLIAFLASDKPKIEVGEAATSNLKKGLDLQGGTRVLLKPIAEKGEVTEKNIGDIIKVLSNRLNVYGLSDLRIRSSRDWQGQSYILLEIAGVSKDEVKDLIAQQGKFEAKIANQTVFTGGKKDITFVCRDDGTCSGIRNCFSISQNQYACKFQFTIHISPEAAKRHANITKNLEVITGEDGYEMLNENIDFYLDEKQVDSLRIGADLKGSETTQIAISGTGVGNNRNTAIEAALNNMNKLQTILITGSLPFDLEIEKLDSISPSLGKQFVKNSIFVGLVAILAVALVVYIRYRSIKVLFPMVMTSLSELLIILGFAALIEWNLDIAAIAGIIASLGTGVDDQIVILDEVARGQERYSNWKRRIKRAFFMIFASYATTVAAMAPLWNAGAGLVRGFAITTIVGVSVGVFLTRPAFAAIVEKMFRH